MSESMVLYKQETTGVPYELGPPSIPVTHLGHSEEFLQSLGTTGCYHPYDA